MNYFRRLDTQSFAPTYPQPTANYVAADNSDGDGSWYPDSGATHHVTNDLANLTVNAPYSSTDTLAVVNGAGLPITHLGSSTIPTSNGNLYLRNVLLVPSIHKNLLSVQRFCIDNQAIFMFDGHRFCVKDRI